MYQLMSCVFCVILQQGFICHFSFWHQFNDLVLKVSDFYFLMQYFLCMRVVLDSVDI